MSFKFVAILSVIVLAAVIQVHGSDENSPLKPEYLSQTEILLQVEQLIERIGNEIEDSLKTVHKRTTSTEEESLDISDEYIPQGQVTGVIKNLFKKLKGLVDTGFNKLRQAIEFAKSKINQAAEKAETFAKLQLQGIEDDLAKELDEIKEQAKAAGKDIDDCLDGNENRLLDLSNKFSGEVVGCVSNKALQAVSYLEDAINEGQEVIGKVVNIKDKIDNCGKGFKRYICIAKLVVIVGKDVVTLPAMIEANMMLAQRALSQFASKAGKCGSEKVDEMKGEGRDILTNITVCVAPK